MAQIPSVGLPPFDSPEERSQAQAINNVDIDDFLQLMIAELQNQDPLNPLDNSQMLQQISQIREVGATESLTETLESVLLGQNVSSATSLIGKQIQGHDGGGNTAQGLVERISIVDGVPKLHVEGTTSAEPDASPGELDEGTYRYRVLFEELNDEGNPVPFALDLGPILTTGTSEQDQTIRLQNLPLTAGFKQIYRSDNTGTGDFHLVESIDGGKSTYLDGTNDDDLADDVLSTDAQVHEGGRRYTVALSDLAEIQSRKR